MAVVPGGQVQQLPGRVVRAVILVAVVVVVVRGMG